MIDFAQTAYRAFISALNGAGEEARDVWDAMMPEEREFWYGIFQRFVEIAEELEGLSYPDAARSFFVQCANLPWTGQSPRRRLAWQACLRHLVYLYDNSDDVNDLTALEQSWWGWAVERQKAASAPSLAPPPTEPSRDASEVTICPQPQPQTPKRSKRKNRRSR